MALLKISTIANSCKYITLAIDSYEGRELQGRVYHESNNGIVPFDSLNQMILIMENIFLQINYPKKSMEHRQFHHMQEFAEKQETLYPIIPVGCADEIKGNLGTIRLQVKGRYHATWQGEMILLEKSEYYIFESFLELIRIIDHMLGEKSTIQMDLNMRQIFKVAMDDKMEIGGRLYQPPQFRQYEFNNIIELMRLMDCSVEKSKKDMEEGFIPALKTKPKRALEVQRVQERKVIFIIRILFEENATWQGTAIFKMTGEQVCFRSFLELVMLMSNAMIDYKMCKDVSILKTVASGS